MRAAYLGMMDSTFLRVKTPTCRQGIHTILAVGKALTCANAWELKPHWWLFKTGMMVLWLSWLFVSCCFMAIYDLIMISHVQVISLRFDSYFCWGEGMFFCFFVCKTMVMNLHGSNYILGGENSLSVTFLPLMAWSPLAWMVVWVVFFNHVSKKFVFNIYLQKIGNWWEMIRFDYISVRFCFLKRECETTSFHPPKNDTLQFAGYHSRIGRNLRLQCWLHPDISHGEKWQVFSGQWGEPFDRVFFGVSF